MSEAQPLKRSGQRTVKVPSKSLMFLQRVELREESPCTSAATGTREYLSVPKQQLPMAARSIVRLPPKLETMVLKLEQWDGEGKGEHRAHSVERASGRVCVTGFRGESEGHSLVQIEKGSESKR